MLQELSIDDLKMVTGAKQVPINVQITVVEYNYNYNYSYNIIYAPTYIYGSKISDSTIASGNTYTLESKTKYHE